MKNIIIVGDSFSANSTGWPSQLATNLDLNLVSYGKGGVSWWTARHFLQSLSPDIKDNTEVIVICQTFYSRIPTLDVSLCTLDYTKLDTKIEKQNAIYLYQKYILDDNFLKWTQQQWFKEINDQWAHIKLVNLHCFPFSIESGKRFLSGVNVLPSLMSISLDELGITELSLFNDLRINHLNDINNTELARQLTNTIVNYSPGECNLDTTTFEQKNNYWKSQETQ